MVFALLRRSNLLASATKFLLSPQKSCRFSSSKFPTSNRLHLSPLFSDINKYDMSECKIELVDDEAWRVSSGLADAWRGNEKDKPLEMESGFIDQEGDGNDLVGSMNLEDTNVDFDAIEDMRVRGDLYYKLDKGSKEYEEYKFDFHGRKHVRNERNGKESKGIRKEDSNEKHTKKIKDSLTEIRNTRESRMEVSSGSDNKVKNLMFRLNEEGESSFVGKKQRSSTFNQLTAPYHEPFCLDVHVTKGSVRASIIHRATSKVVAVSHSISKDMKMDLGSTKNKSACGAVGEVLARTALADDIHNVVYTPRKGDKIEGKLQIVLESIIDGGVDVKVKLKQKNSRKARSFTPPARD